MTATFKAIPAGVAMETDFGDIKIEAVNIEKNTKVLILKNCRNLPAIPNQNAFIQTVRHSPIFVIIAYHLNAINEEELTKICDKIGKPFILQIENVNFTRLLFTNDGNELKEVEIGDQYRSSDIDLNFIFSMLQSKPETFGKLTFELMNLEINTEACSEGKKLIDFAIEHGNILMLKFLLIFEPEIETINEDKQRILEIAVEKGNLEFLKIILRIPAECENFETLLSSENRNALNLVSNNDMSLLMLAAGSGKREIVKFLLECGLNVNFLNKNDQTACDFAWNNEHHDCIIELMEADSPFPYEFDPDQLPAGSDLKKISEERDSLHLHIRNNHNDVTMQFVENSPKFKCAYDRRNQCALVTALESKNFEIYSFLRSKGFGNGIDPDYKKMLSALNDSEKEALKFLNRSYFPTSKNWHELDLVNRSRLGFGSMEQENFEKIEIFFKALDVIPEVQPILKIISLARNLDIVFDFKEESIADMDPTQDFVHTVVRGRTIYNNGTILIGAKNTNAEVLATMAHEFTHYAMHLLYDNLGHPCLTDDEYRKQEFSKIVNFCKARKSRNPVIKNVFSYAPDEYPVELIVRVPHLLALHLQGPDITPSFTTLSISKKLVKARKNFGKLFSFFADRVLSDCEQNIPAMAAKQKIRELNNVLGLKKRAEAMKLFSNRSEIDFEEVVQNPTNILILSPTPILVLCHLLNCFKKNGIIDVDSLHIFIKLAQVLDQQFGDMIQEALNTTMKPKLFVFETEDATDLAKISEVFNCKVVAIAKSISITKENEGNYASVFPKQLQVKYDWSDLNKNSKAKFLSSKVKFQGTQTPLNQLLTVDCKILRELTLEKVFQLPNIQIKNVDEFILSSPEVFINRKFFCGSNQAAETLTAENVVQLLNSGQSLILANESGMGKTVSALHLSTKLKEIHSHSWVVHIDLKLHTDSFHKNDKFLPAYNTSDFLSAKILKLEATVEMKFFEHFYENKKVIFIVDGFDEICPDYKKYVLKIVENIQKSRNLLLVTTRTHLLEAIRERMSSIRMSSRIIRLHPFTFDEQVDFLQKFWSRDEARPVNDLETKARSLLQNFQETMTREAFFGVPLRLCMLAEIYERSDPTEKEMRNLNIFSLYERFIDKKIDIWFEKEPQACKVFLKSRSSNIWQIHQKLAIEIVFNEEIAEAMELPKIEEPLTKDLLARIGLIQVEESKKFLFTHQSLAEYFVADFVLSNVTKKTLLAKSDELHKMFLKTLKDKNFENVRSFINGKLEMNQNLNVDVLSSKLEKSLQVEMNQQFLETLEIEKLDALITFMQKTVKINSKLVSDEKPSVSSASECIALDPILKSIVKEVTLEIDGERLEDSVNIRTNVQILILKDCKKLTTIVDSDFLENVLNSQIFVIVVRLSETCYEKEFCQLSDKTTTPIILQIDTAGSSQLFFTNTDKKFEEVQIVDSYNERLTTHFDFNFVCNLLYSEPEKFGKFSSEITEMKMDPNACFQGKRLIDLAVENGDLLTLKFLMLFQPDLEALNGDRKRILEILVENGNQELLNAVLGVPDQADNFEMHLSAEKRNALNLMSDNDLSLLMIAAKSGKNEIIRFLLKCGLNLNILNESDHTACDLAWINGYYDSVNELVKADSPFPYEFDLDQLSVGSEIRKINDERKILHKQIMINQIDEVRKFVDQNPRIKCAYDSRNQSALVTALESKNFEIYSFLRSKGYTSGIDGYDVKILSALNDFERIEISLSNLKYFPTNENSHINDLLSRSRLGFGSEQKNFKKIQQYFEALDAIPEVRPILQVISLAKTLDIVFDFNRESIADMDPTQNFMHTVVKGRTIYNNGNILLGAKSDDAEVLATIAHEFTHYAMHLIYDNHGHPYYADDESRKHEFAEIVNVYEMKKSLNPVIENVSLVHSQDEYAVELIARVPHLLALHSQDPNAITKLRHDFGNLFRFYTDRVLPECHIEMPVIKAKKKIRGLNGILKLKKELEASMLSCDESNIDIDEIVNKSENILITSSVPNLVLCNLLNNFNKNGTRSVDSLHIFLKLQQLMDPKHGDMIRKAFESNVEPKLFVLETKEVIHYAEIKEFFNYPIMSSKVVLIANSVSVEKKDEEMFKNVFPIQCQINYDWNDLNETSKSAILSSKVQFQGLEMPLSDLLTTDSEIFKELPLEEIFKLKEMELKTGNESELPNVDIYIERKFSLNSYQSVDTLTTDDVIELLISEKSLILANDSGMGKTTTALHLFYELKNRHSHSWVVHIDLKLHTDSFYRDEEVSSEEITSEFFSSKILKSEGHIETKFFKHFYESGKVIFIIDGFDEISPVYTSRILEVVEAIQDSKNKLLVTTRVHSTKVLEESMTLGNESLKIIKLHPLTIDDQVEFLVKFWSRNNNLSVQEFEARARSLLENFIKLAPHEDLFSVPLQVLMMAEIYEKTDPTEDEIRELNIYSLYRIFISKRIDTWMDKGPLAKRYNTALKAESCFNILQIHQKIALENFFVKDTIRPFMLPEIDENFTDELLEGIGLVQVEAPRKYLFTHRSFSEYLVADFILSNVTQKTLLAKSDDLHEMFLETLKDQKFDKVRSFMNGKLELKEKLNIVELSKKLEKSFEFALNRRFFGNLVKENLIAMVTFMLTTVQISSICKFSLITHKNDRGDETLHFAARFCTLPSFNRIWSCIKSFCKENELADLLISTGFYNFTVLNRAIISENNKVTEEILRNALELMDPSTFKKLIMLEDNSRHDALNKAAIGNPNAFDIVWKAVESKLEPEDRKKILFRQNLQQRNVLLNALVRKCNGRDVRVRKVIQSILEIAKSLFNYEEMRKFLFTEDQFRDTALHFAVFYGDLETFTMLWNFIKEQLNRPDQKALWQMKHDRNIFVKSIECELFDNIIAKEVIAAAKEILNPLEIREALTERNYLNLSFVIIAKNRAVVNQVFDPEDLEWVAEEFSDYKLSLTIQVESGNYESNKTCRTLSDALKNDIESGELKSLLYAEAEDGGMTLPFVLQYGTCFLADKIFQLVDMKFSTIEHRELIQTRSPSGATILERANNNFLVMKSLCNFLVRQTDLICEIQELFLLPDRFGKNFFSNAAILNGIYLLVVLEWFKENLTLNDLQKVLFEPNNNYQILGCEIAQYCNADLVKKILEFCVSSIDLSVFKEMILIRFHDHNDMLEFALRNETSAVVIEVWKFYVQALNSAELEEFLFKNNQGRTYFRIRGHKNPKAVEKLKTVVIERFGEKQARKLIR